MPQELLNIDVIIYTYYIFLEKLIFMGTEIYISEMTTQTELLNDKILVFKIELLKESGQRMKEETL